MSNHVQEIKNSFKAKHGDYNSPSEDLTFFINKYNIDTTGKTDEQIKNEISNAIATQEL